MSRHFFILEQLLLLSIWVGCLVFGLAFYGSALFDRPATPPIAQRSAPPPAPVVREKPAPVAVAPVIAPPQVAPREKAEQILIPTDPIVPASPENGAEIEAGQSALSLRFSWRYRGEPPRGSVFQWELAEDRAFARRLATRRTPRLFLDVSRLGLPAGNYFWRVILLNGKGEVLAKGPGVLLSVIAEPEMQAPASGVQIEADDAPGVEMEDERNAIPRRK